MGIRHGPLYTIAMVALGLGITLNILSIIDLLWTLGYLSNPYQTDGGLRPQRYLCALICVAFIINTILARRKFSADSGKPWRSQHPVSAIAAPRYMLVSSILFLVTLTMQTPST
ncbi:MAG: hypothetical protein WDM77_20330 [Steroidobacteraceae bacterium]